MMTTNEIRSALFDRRSRRVRANRCCDMVLAIMVTASAFGAQTPTPPKQQDEQDRELAEKLKRKASTGADEDLMDSIIRLMNESARRIEIDFDAGDDTQSVQRQVVDRLDEAIKIAASQRRPKRSRKQPSGDKRRMAQSGKTEKDQSASKQRKAGASTSTDELPPGAAAQDGKTSGGTLEPTRSSTAPVNAPRL